MKKSIFPLLLLCLLAACSKGGDPYGRSAALTTALQAVDDSIRANAPGCDTMISDGMQQATDSLTFYDYYIRHLELRVYRQQADTIGNEWTRVTAFLRQQPLSPRINGMRAFVANIRGAQRHQLHRDHDATLQLYQEAYRWVMQSDIIDKAPSICANMGDEYLFANQLPTASAWYRRALYLADSLHVPPSQSADLTIGLAQIYVSLSDYASAAACYQQIERQFDSLSTPMKGFFINSYGNYFYFKGDLQASLRQFQRLERFYRGSHQSDGLPMRICWLNMANLYADMGQDALAQHYLALAEPMIRQMNDTAAGYYVDNIHIALAAHRGDAATINRILAATPPDLDVDYRSRNVRSRYLIDFYKRQGNNAKALQALESYVEGNDSLQHNQQHMRTADLIARHVEDTLRLHNQVAVAQKQAQVDHVSMWVGILVALIIIVVLLAAYIVNLQREKQLNMSVQLQDMRLTLLRNRISPHFIFNMLNNNLANSDRADNIQRLTKLIRSNLDLTGRGTITLTEEVAFVNAYIDNVRSSLGSDFVYNLTVPPTATTDRIKLPSMLLQIMVENAVKHGLRQRHEGQRLDITIACGDSQCAISVTDNGPGFDVTKADDGLSHHGLNIIRNTLELVNKGQAEKMRFTITNLRNTDGTISGCQSQLLIPLANVPTN